MRGDAVVVDVCRGCMCISMLCQCARDGQEDYGCIPMRSTRAAVEAMVRMRLLDSVSTEFEF